VQSSQREQDRALLLTVLAFNLVGDGLQDALNPRTGR